MFKRWSKYAGAIVALLLVSAVALVIGVVGASLLQSISTVLVGQAEWTQTNSVQASFTIRSIMNFYYVIYGIIFLGFFFLMENRLITTGVPRQLVLKRTSFTLGIELIVLAVIQLVMLVYLPASLLHILTIVVEALASIGLVYIGRRKVTVT